LVQVANPTRFNWPGYWLAVLRSTPGERPDEDGTAVLMFGSPSGVVLSPQDAALLGVAASGLPVREGYVLAALDPALTMPGTPLPQLRGMVEAITVTDQATKPMRHVQQAQALAGRGLDGDRYAARWERSPRPTTTFAATTSP
jgi:hypothetical protein